MSAVAFDKDHFYDPTTGRALLGLHRVLRRTCWPHYVARRQSRSSSSASRGSRVDKELAGAGTGAGTKGLDLFTRKIIAQLGKAGYRVVATQVPVRLGPVATALDAILESADGTRVAAEVKTGRDGVWTRSSGTSLLRPFHTLPNNERIHAHVQLAWGAAAAGAGAGLGLGLDIRNSVVILVNRSRCVIERLDARVLKALPTLLAITTMTPAPASASASASRAAVARARGRGTRNIASKNVSNVLNTEGVRSRK